jgi:hypothetical protein
VGRPLWREDGAVFCRCCWPVPAQSFLGPSPVGLATIFYCLRFETSPFVASYDSQGHGGGWSGVLKWSPIPVFSYILLARTTHRKKYSTSIAAWRRPHRKHLSSTFAWRHRACVNVFTEPLPSNASQYAITTEICLWKWNVTWNQYEMFWYDGSLQRVKSAWWHATNVFIGSTNNLQPKKPNSLDPKTLS